MTEYEYIVIEELGRSASGKTGIFEVRNKQSDVHLGFVNWYPRWRQYVFCPEADTVFSVGCMKDISEFIKVLR